MANRMFGNSQILAWLQYYAENTEIDLEKVKILDITRKNKNLIPTVESNDAVLVFTEAGHADIFYRMWSAGLGDCDVWYNTGSEPSGPIEHSKLKNMIDRGINVPHIYSAVYNNFSEGRMRLLGYVLNDKMKLLWEHGTAYVGLTEEEIRAVILNKMHMASDDTVCVISGESIAVEAALIAGEGTVIAVEYNGNDRRTMEENIEQFGLNNIAIIDHVDDESMKDLPVPSLAMLVASASMEQEIACLLRLNPHMEFVIYTLDFRCAAALPDLFAKFGIGETEVIQISVSKMNAKHNFEAEPAPWLITGRA